MSDQILDSRNNQVLKSILCEILEIEPDELREDASFENDYDADSLRAVEILASLEKEFSLTIPESELRNMSTLREVKVVLRKYGWAE